jgi:hypothetical protein
MFEDNLISVPDDANVWHGYALAVRRGSVGRLINAGYRATKVLRMQKPIYTPIENIVFWRADLTPKVLRDTLAGVACATYKD